MLERQSERSANVQIDRVDVRQLRMTFMYDY